MNPSILYIHGLWLENPLRRDPLVPTMTSTIKGVQALSGELRLTKLASEIELFCEESRMKGQQPYVVFHLCLSEGEKTRLERAGSVSEDPGQRFAKLKAFFQCRESGCGKRRKLTFGRKTVRSYRCFKKVYRKLRHTAIFLCTTNDLELDQYAQIHISNRLQLEGVNSVYSWTERQDYYLNLVTLLASVMQEYEDVRLSN